MCCNLPRSLGTAVSLRYMSVLHTLNSPAHHGPVLQPTQMDRIILVAAKGVAHKAYGFLHQLTGHKCGSAMKHDGGVQGLVSAETLKLCCE